MLSNQPQPVSFEDRIAAIAEAAWLEIRDEHRRVQLPDARLRETPEIELPVCENRILEIEGAAEFEDASAKEC